jgi:hypothetical protein
MRSRKAEAETPKAGITLVIYFEVTRVNRVNS